MSKTIAAIALTLILVASRADAQMIVATNPPGRTWRAIGPTYADVNVIPYSYYVAMPEPARGYVGYGTSDFPYYGRAYGHPYDPWSYEYISGYPYSALSRYYYPPLR